VRDALGHVTDRWEAFTHAMADPERGNRIEDADPDGIKIGVSSRPRRRRLDGGPTPRFG
jgi:hypothetical protein